MRSPTQPQRPARGEPPCTSAQALMSELSDAFVMLPEGRDLRGVHGVRTWAARDPRQDLRHPQRGWLLRRLLVFVRHGSRARLRQGRQVEALVISTMSKSCSAGLVGSSSDQVSPCREAPRSRGPWSRLRRCPGSNSTSASSSVSPSRRGARPPSVRPSPLPGLLQGRGVYPRFSNTSSPPRWFRHATAASRP